MKKLALMLIAVFAVMVMLPITSVEARTCFQCGGSGRIEKYEGDYHRYGKTVKGRGTYYETCPSCHGSGQKD